MAFGARLIAASAWLAAASGFAFAEDGPQPWAVTMQAPATKVMDYIEWFGSYTLIIVALIVALVMVLLGWCIVRYNERANPVPSRVTHNTTIEVLWTIIPVLILVAIAIPSFRLLYGEYDPSKLYENFDPNTPFLTLKVTGVQWAWQADYANDEESAGMGVEQPISLYMLPVPDDQLKDGQVRSLSVDNPIIVPVDTFVRLQVTAEGEAIHSFAMPAFGLKEDAVPGRLNEVYFNADREGVFYGQCSELCGKDHAFMPIEIRAVSKDQFRAWAAEAPSDTAAAYKTLARAMQKQEAQKVAAR